MTLTLLVSLILNINLGQVGSLIIWRRLSNFGDSLAHSMIFSIIIPQVFGISLEYATFLTAFMFAVLFHFLSSASQEKNLELNIINNVLVATTIIYSQSNSSTLGLNMMIFGDILSIDSRDLSYVIMMFLVTTYFIYSNYQQIILSTFNAELAHVNGINVKRLELFISLIIALNIAAAIKIIGAMLMSVNLIIPAAIARQMSTQPYIMILYSILIGAAVTLCSLYISLSYLDVSPSALSTIFLGAMYMTLKLSKSKSFRTGKKGD